MRQRIGSPPGKKSEKEIKRHMAEMSAGCLCLAKTEKKSSWAHIFVYAKPATL